jgi:hypothetical protein
MENNKPTRDQIKALRNFRIPEAEIQSMSFLQARERIGNLIDEIKAKKGNNANPGRTEENEIAVKPSSAAKPSEGKENPTRSTPPSEELNVTAFLESSLDIAIGIVANQVSAGGVKPSKDYILRNYTPIIVELLREQEAIYIAERIQKGKRENIDKINRDRGR